MKRKCLYLGTLTCIVDQYNEVNYSGPSASVDKCQPSNPRYRSAALATSLVVVLSNCFLFYLRKRDGAAEMMAVNHFEAWPALSKSLRKSGYVCLVDVTVPGTDARVGSEEVGKAAVGGGPAGG